MISRHYAIAALAVVAVALAGCGIKPLYATNADGTGLRTELAAVEVTPIPGRVGQRVRNELIFENTGGGEAAPSRYKLDIVVKEATTDEMVLTTGEPTGQVCQLDATFKLTRKSDGKIIVEGRALGRAAFDRYVRTFSNVRADFDAENRAAETVAESIKTQIAAYLSST